MGETKKNILFINHTSNIGGAELILIDVINLVSQTKSFNIYVAYPLDSTDRFRELLMNIDDVKVVKRLPFRGVRRNTWLFIRNFLYSLYAFITLILFCKKNKIDIIYTNTSVNIIGRIISIVLNIKHIWHIHEQLSLNSRWFPDWFIPIQKKLINKKNSISIFVSQKSLNSWQDIFNEKIKNGKVIYNRYRTFERIHKNYNRNDVVLGYMGSLSNIKNLAMFLESFKFCISKYPEIKLSFNIAGIGKEMSELKEKCNDLKISKNVNFIGFISEPKDFFKDIDIFVLPSLSESWGLSAIEAIYAKKGLILTKESGLTDIFKDKMDCLIIDPLKKDCISSAIGVMLKNETFRDEMIHNSFNKLIELDLNNKFKLQILELLYSF